MLRLHRDQGKPWNRSCDDGKRLQCQIPIQPQDHGEESPLQEGRGKGEQDLSGAGQPPNSLERGDWNSLQHLRHSDLSGEAGQRQDEGEETAMQLLKEGQTSIND